MKDVPTWISLAIDGNFAVHIDSYGHVHGIPASYDLMADLREFIRDPHVSPTMRTSTGQEPDVRVHVLAAPGAQQLVDHLVGAALALLSTAPPTRLVRIGLGCQGGRHRSVAVAEAIAVRIRMAGHGVFLEHHHVNTPIVRRTS